MISKSSAADILYVRKGKSKYTSILFSDGNVYNIITEFGDCGSGWCSATWGKIEKEAYDEDEDEDEDILSFLKSFDIYSFNINRIKTIEDLYGKTDDLEIFLTSSTT